MTTEPLVRLDNVTVHGTHTNGVFAFKNIPYAQAERFGLPTAQRARTEPPSPATA